MPRALILLDLQNDMVDPEGALGKAGLAKVVAQREVVVHAARALAAFRAAKQPVFHVRLGFRADYADSISVAPRVAKLRAARACITGTWGTEFPLALAPAAGEVVITKGCVNAFFNTPLASLLQAAQVREVVLGGVATNMAVESAARYAEDAGFAVTVLEECCASAKPEWHQHAIEQMLPLFGRVTRLDALVQSADWPRA